MNYSDWTTTKQDVINAIITLTDYCQRYYNDGKCSGECAFCGECQFYSLPPMRWRIPNKLKENL